MAASHARRCVRLWSQAPWSGPWVRTPGWEASSSSRGRSLPRKGANMKTRHCQLLTTASKPANRCPQGAAQSTGTRMETMPLVLMTFALPLPALASYL